MPAALYPHDAVTVSKHGGDCVQLRVLLADIFRGEISHEIARLLSCLR